MAYVNEAGKIYVGREFSGATIREAVLEFAKWWRVQGLGSEPFNAVGIHHTWKPTQASWAGRTTLAGVFSYYKNELGWPEGVGPHLWLHVRPAGGVSIYVGTHPAHDGIGIAGRNRRWLHIEQVADFDTNNPSSVQNRLLGEVLGVVCGKRIPLRYITVGRDNPATPLGLMYHRDVDTINPPKSCPGKLYTHRDEDPEVLAAARTYLASLEPKPVPGPGLLGPHTVSREQAEKYLLSKPNG